jgi:phosphoenolpyruvate synthase/pyruvate phosphate dikinase
MDQKDLLDGKGANLAQMVRIGLPMTPGFTISTGACRAYLAAVTVPPDWTRRSPATDRILQRTPARIDESAVAGHARRRPQLVEM